MATNTYTPAGLTYKQAYGWSAHPGYTSADVPGVDLAKDPQALKARTAYEWFGWGSTVGSAAGFARTWHSNPPFRTKAAGELLTTLVNSEDGRSARILRGFIRRSEYNVADPPSMSRLYFMYNPEQIQREYVNYLDQGALDPFNTVFQSGNLVAPPSFMNFTFELFFDRQDEAASPNNPGVFVDYEYFDLVVRNVVPGTSGNNSLPDNGVMMVNPRDITVVFSPEITVQGRPLNASVAFEKFTHRMTPTRMRINLTMRVIYFGPMREMTQFTQDEMTATGRIPWGKTEPERYNFTYSDLVVNDVEGTPAGGPGAPTGLTDSSLILGGMDMQGQGASVQANYKALQHAISRDAANNTQYDANRRSQLWNYADCSSLVWGAWAELGYSQALGWPKWGSGWPPACQSMLDGFRSGNTCLRIMGFDQSGGTWQADKQWLRIPLLKPGDLVYRVNNSHYSSSSNHVAIVVSASSSSLTVFHAGSASMDVDDTTYSGGSQLGYNYAVRPLPLGQSQVNNAATSSTGGGNFTPRATPD